MNGKRPPLTPLEQALAQGAGNPAVGQKQMSPLEPFVQFFGLNVPTFQALMPNVVPCLCGRCQGVGVQLEVRMHFPLMGPAELIRRGDAERVPAVGEETTEEGKG